MNLLTDNVFTLSDGHRVSLPALLAAMARDEVRSFPALRPHQRPAWHMFLVQLGTLAVWMAKRMELPTHGADWTAMLRALTPIHDDDAPWTLVVDDRSKPAFMQPPAPDARMKWTTVATPDALDLLITARNHDLKQAVAKCAAPEDWAFALVSLQTSEGFGGSGNYGIARMNGGSSSRPLLGLAPAHDRGTSINPSASWARDVRRLVNERDSGSKPSVGQIGGSALLWTLDWREGDQLEPAKLDPWFIEVCRRVRLTERANEIIAQRSTSKCARTLASAFKGNLGDPWAPVHTDGKCLTLGGGSFDYAKLHDLLYSGNWKVPLLAKPDAADEGDMLLVAEALSRGNSKTEGFKSCVVPVPRRAIQLFASPGAAEIAKEQMAEIKTVNDALCYAVALAAAHGVWNGIKKSHYDYAKPAVKQFNHAVDRVFFPSLWRRVAAKSESEDADTDARVAFLRKLKLAADLALASTLPATPCPTVHRTRAEIRAHRAFLGKLRKDPACRGLFN